MEDPRVNSIYVKAYRNVEKLTKYLVWIFRVYVILFDVVTILSLTYYNNKHNTSGNWKESLVQIYPAAYVTIVHSIFFIYFKICFHF